MGAADVTEPSPILPLIEQSKPKTDPRPTPNPAHLRQFDTLETPEQPEAGFVVGLAALSLVGIAVVASQFPYGRLVAAVLAVLGIVGGVVSLGAEGRAKLAGGVAIGLHAFVLIVVLLLPSWLNLDPWRAPAGTSHPDGPLAIEHGTGQLRPLSAGEWIDATKYSWERDDIRVTVRSASVGPVELSGPKDAKKTPKNQYLQLRLRVVNSGVEREVTLSGWAAGRIIDDVRIVEPAGNLLKPALFDENWKPDRGKPAEHLFPSQSSEPRLVFAAPAAKVEWLRLQLPGSAIGMPNEEIKFQIGAGFLNRITGP
jgi:hypothetical protein